METGTRRNPRGLRRFLPCSGAFAPRRVARMVFAREDKESAVAIVSPAADSFGAFSLSAGERETKSG